MSKGLLIGGAILVALVIGIVSIFGYVNGLQKTGVQYETALNAQYLDNQNELSSYKASFYEQIGVANLKSDKMDQILEDAVKGRYEGKMDPGTSGSLFSAIAEAYPDISGLNIYDKIIDHIKAGREAYKQKQSKLLDMLRGYDQWRQSGIIQSRVISAMGYPSNALRAQIGTNAKYGQAALDQMYVIVLTSDTVKAYETGIDEPLQVPGQK